MQFNLTWPQPKVRTGSLSKSNWLFMNKFSFLSDCDQHLFVNQKPNFSIDTVSSFFSMIHASVKSYRSALFPFRMNNSNSLAVLRKGHLPMSLIPMESLLAVLDSVRLRQSEAGSQAVRSRKIGNQLVSFRPFLIFAS